MTKRLTLAGSLLGVPFDLEVIDRGKMRVDVKGSIWNKPVDLIATVDPAAKSFKIVGSLLGEPLKVEGSDQS